MRKKRGECNAAAVTNFRQDILQAATKLVRELAREMDCSTQPIYSTFANMADLNDALMDYIRQTYLRKQL